MESWAYRKLSDILQSSEEAFISSSQWDRMADGSHLKQATTAEGFFYIIMYVISKAE